MNEIGAKNSEKVGLFQIVVLILSIVVLGALGADAAFKLPKEVSTFFKRLTRWFVFFCSLISEFDFTKRNQN